MKEDSHKHNIFQQGKLFCWSPLTTDSSFAYNKQQSCAPSKIFSKYFVLKISTFISAPGDSGWRLSSPQRQQCFNMIGSHATPVFLVKLEDVGDIEVESETKGLDLVLEIGFGRPLVVFSVDECLALMVSSMGKHLFCIWDNSAIADIGSRDLKWSEVMDEAAVVATTARWCRLSTECRICCLMRLLWLVLWPSGSGLVFPSDENRILGNWEVDTSLLGFRPIFFLLQWVS